MLFFSDYLVMMSVIQFLFGPSKNSFLIQTTSEKKYFIPHSAQLVMNNITLKQV